MTLFKLYVYKCHVGILILLTLLSLICHCQAQQTVKIGLLAPLTGDNKTIGQSVSAAVTAALPEANKYLSPYDIQINLVEKDTKGDPDQALEGLMALDAEGTKIVIGPCFSSSAQRCLSYANSKDIVMISPSSTSTSLCKDDYLFRMLPPDNNQGAALAQYISSINIKDVLPVYINDSYGKSLESAFEKTFKELSGNIIKGVSFKASEITNISLINKIAKAANGFSEQKNAAILFIGYGELDTFFTNAADNSLLSKFRWITSEALLASSPNFLDNETLYSFAQTTKMATVSIHPENIITDLYSLHINKQAKAQLRQSDTLSHFAYPAWDAFWLAVEAIRKQTSGDTATLLQAIKDLGSGDAFYGMNQLHWNKNGDSSNSSFYMLAVNIDKPYWQTKAICQINPNWSEPNLTSISDINWPPSKSPSSLSLHGLIPLSGDVKLTSAKTGFELAVEHINDYFKSANINTTIHSVIHDTETDPAVALATAKDLYYNDSVPMFIGPCVSSIVDNVTSNLSDVCLLSPTSTAIDLAKSDDYVARICPTDAAQAKALATLITMDGVDKVAIIYRDDIWGQGIKSAFSDSFNGATQPFAYNIDTTDFSYLIEDVEDYIVDTLAKKKAVLLVSFDEAATIFNQIDENSQLLDYSWYGTDGVANISVMLEEGPGKKAAQTGLQCSTYSPYIVNMFSPRLLLFNQWINDSMHQAADPNTVLTYDATWLAMFAYLLNNSETTPFPGAIWSKLTEQADLLTGFSYAETLDANGDRLSNYYSFYQLQENDDNLSWNAVNSFMESSDASKSLKREGTIANKSGSKLSIKYKRNNYYSNGVFVTEKHCDMVKTDNLPLGEFQIPENLILDNGVMTGTLSVFIDGNYFPCDTIYGDWEKSDDLSSYVFTNSKEKMNSNYYPMTLEVNHTEARWSFNTSKILLEKLDWSDGVEVRIDVNRQPVVILTYKPDLRLKLSFQKGKNGIDYTSTSIENTFAQMAVSKMMTCYSSKTPWKNNFIISTSDFMVTDAFNPGASGVTLTANDNSWAVLPGRDWGSKTAQGLYKHSNKTGSSKTQWLFDTVSGTWQFNAKGVNTIGIANTLIEDKGIKLQLSSGNDDTNMLLLKPKINATLDRSK